ncbi:nucleotidyltransferase family protein [Dyadobacter bucti]|uniref:nucleotidyltransferase family protein n=1 Tax=Dyadobacter bucti TaxID=2572203 RepID=UPI00197A92BA
MKSSKPPLLKFGVKRIGLFGSARRDEMTKESDIDILIDFDLEKETCANFM